MCNTITQNMTATKSEIEKSKTVVTNVYATNVQYNYAENNQQTNNFTANDISTLKEIVDYFENNTRQLDIADDVKGQIEEETTAIKEETKRDKPNRQIIKLASTKIVKLLEDVACHIVAAGIVEKLHLFTR